MLKFTLAISAAFVSFAATARYPDGKCTATDTKLIYENAISFGKRVQMTNPMFCANGRYFAILAWESGDRHADHVSGLCGIFQSGTYVNHDIRAVDHEEMASFDQKGNFNGVMDFNKAQEEESYAVRALTCQLP